MSAAGLARSALEAIAASMGLELRERGAPSPRETHAYQTAAEHAQALRFAEARLDRIVVDVGRIAPFAHPRDLSCEEGCPGCELERLLAREVEVPADGGEVRA